MPLDPQVSGALACLVQAAIIGCAPTSAALDDRPHLARGCEVTLEINQPAPLVLSVAAECAHYRPDGFMAEPGVQNYLSQAHSTDGLPLQLEAGRLRLPQQAGGVRYLLDLGRMALEQDDLNVALQVGDSILAPTYSWLLSPTGVPDDTPVMLRWSGGSRAIRFATGLTPADSGYLLRANEIKVATFSVFGRFHERELKLPGVQGDPASINVVTLDGPLRVAPREVQRWVLDTSQAVADFYGGFPVERALLALVPVAGETKVTHGKVLPESSPGIAILLGSDTSVGRLHSDWILTHELFHLGFPSFVGEGKWLDEGLATYFEPLIRARRGWLSEEQVWAEFYHNMPRGLSVLERDGLESPKSMRAMYWAGATVSLLTDLEARRRSNHARSLQRALQKLLRAGGDATRVWRLDTAIAHIDQSLGAPILKQLRERFAKPKRPVQLQKLFSDLGVYPQADSVRLDDRAPLASARRAITRGRP